MDDNSDGDGDSDGDACAAATEINELYIEGGEDEEVEDDGACGWSEWSEPYLRTTESCELGSDDMHACSTWIGLELSHEVKQMATSNEQEEGVVEQVEVGAVGRELEVRTELEECLDLLEDEDAEEAIDAFLINVFSYSV